MLQHIPYEPLGMLDPHLRASGFRIRYVNFGRHPQLEPDIRRYDGLVVLGGPMNVDQLDRHPHLARGIGLLHGALAREIPVLGICLGAQLLAAAFGALASELIAEAVVAMEFGASSEDIGMICHAHPSLSEAMKDAALAVDRRALNI